MVVHDIAGGVEAVGGGRIRGRLTDAVNEAAAVDASLSLCLAMANKMNNMTGSFGQLSDESLPTERSGQASRERRCYDNLPSPSPSIHQSGSTSLLAVVRDLQRISAVMERRIASAQSVVGSAKQSMQDAMHLLESAVAARR